jgi:2-iminobutanoate/2-iminopropanoate deaminase
LSSPCRAQRDHDGSDIVHRTTAQRFVSNRGCSRTAASRTRNYVRDAEEVLLYNQLYREYFAAPFPTRTTITNCLSSALRYEIECIAVARS